MRIFARPDVGALPFRRRLALALAVLFGRDDAIMPFVAPMNRATRRALGHSLEGPLFLDAKSNGRRDPGRVL